MTSIFRLIFLELCSNLCDLLANGIKAIQDFPIYLTFGLESFLEIHASVSIPVVENGVMIRLVEHISSYYLFFFLDYKILVWQQ
jgi:hypothetical protein